MHSYLVSFFRRSVVLHKEHTRRIQVYPNYISHKKEMGGRTLSKGQE